MWPLSACIEWLFAEEEPGFADRIERCAAAGLSWVEFWGWRDKDVALLRESLTQYNVQVAGFLSQPEGRLVDPRTHDLVVQGVAESAAVAESLGCTKLVMLAGARVAGASEADQRAALVAGLGLCAPVAAEHGVTLVLEPINTRLEDPEYFLDSARTGLDLVEAVGEPNVQLLFDLYHAMIMEEEFKEAVNGRGELVGHIHLADVPARHEPGSGAIDWEAVMAWLIQIGYRGLLGLEYIPSRDTESSLAYVAQLAGRQSAG
jgi:hydroxypyruvate isomerase